MSVQALKKGAKAPEADIKQGSLFVYRFFYLTKLCFRERIFLTVEVRA